jgi:hypothetical protein
MITLIALVDDHLDLIHGAIKAAPQFRRPFLARTDIGGARNQIVEGDENGLAPIVHSHHCLEQRIDDEMRGVIPHAIESRSLGLDPVQHAIDDPCDAPLELFDPPRRECRHQQTAYARVLLAVHLRDELCVHDLIELLPARASRHLRRKRLRV